MSAPGSLERADPQRAGPSGGAAPAPWLVALAFLLLALCAYAPALRAGYVWDDDSYVTANPNLEDTAGLGRIWLEPRSSPQYYPLVFSGFWLERQLFGESAAAHHAVNVLLHALGAFLFWRLLVRLRLRGALFAALLFLLHPLAVESVAWITERKNVLALAFALGAALCWLRASPLEREPGVESTRPPQAALWWLAALLLFACALLSKTTTACLPLVLGILVWWRRGRLGARELLLLAPLLLLAVPLALQTARLEREHVGAFGVEWDLSLLERTLIAGRVFWFYLEKLVWPHPLVFFYPRWEVDPASPWQLAFPLAVVVLFAVLFFARRRLGRGPLAAALVYGLGIGPASGFFDVYPMRYSFVADHFQHLACLAPLALVASLAARLPLSPRSARLAAAGLLLAVLGGLTWSRTHAFRDAETLWRDTIEQNPASWAARASLGHLCLASGRAAEGRALLEEAARLSPYPSEAWQDVASFRLEEGDLAGALEYLVPLLEARPVVAERTAYVAQSLFDAGRAEDALALLRATLGAVPDATLARLVLAGCLARGGRRAEARAELEEVLRRDPASAEAHYTLGGLEAAEGRPQAALAHYRAALELRPDWPQARRALERLESPGRPADGG